MNIFIRGILITAQPHDRTVSCNKYTDEKEAYPLPPVLTTTMQGRNEYPLFTNEETDFSD